MTGELAVVLHTHMPYVEGYGTWPFGEEWLWEAIATSYLPLLELLDDGAPVTLSLTPVLCDQLEAPGVAPRFARFVRDVRRETHRRDRDGLRAVGEDGLAAEIERSLEDYERARERMAALGGDLLGALGRHAAWTSSATHAVLPLLATDAGVRLQVRTGVASHRRRFGSGWGGGFWLPECGHAPWLDALLVDEGVRAVCVDLSDVLEPSALLRPLRPPAGPLLVPIDRPTIELVWSERGYPADPAYRDYHRRTLHDHRPWAVDGAPYDRARAARAVRAHAADFVARVRDRLAGGGLSVFAVDTELLGHWWYEGPQWLRAMLEEADARRLPVVPLDEALERREPAPAPALGVTTWGTSRDLSTWSAPKVAELAWAARAAELRVLAAGREVERAAVRELLALQSSDWAFMVHRDLAPDYGRARAAGHRTALQRLLPAQGGGRRPRRSGRGAGRPAEVISAAPRGPRHLAPDAAPAPLLAP